MSNATALIWKVLRVAESRWRWLDAPELVKDVYERRRFIDGKPITRLSERAAILMPVTHFLTETRHRVYGTVSAANLTNGRGWVVRVAAYAALAGEAEHG